MQKLTLENDTLVPRENDGDAPVTLENTSNISAQWWELKAAPVIALDFPAFKDGRAFSQARMLRDWGYEGDIRATGDLFRDQIQFAIRCGFTSFDIDTDDDLSGLRASADRYSHHYQPAARGARAGRST